MYVAVKGGEKAIANAHRLLAEQRRGDPAVPELSLTQIKEQLGLAVDRVMTEGSLYDRDLAALAIKQAQGDLVEAVFLLRAYRTTLPRLATSEPLDSARMHIRRRVSAIFKDIPGGQVLGPTYDYTHRLLDFSLGRNGNGADLAGAHGANREDLPADLSDRLPRFCDGGPVEAGHADDLVPRVVDLLRRQGMLEAEPADTDHAPVGDLTRQPLQLPAERDVRLQNLARGDEGFLHALAYSALRGFGYSAHPFVGEIRVGEVAVEMMPDELGFAVEIGEITVTECFMISRSAGSAAAPPGFCQGYGLTFGHCERKAMAMSLLDICLKRGQQEEKPSSPARDEEFVLYHSDNVEASGFVQHLKLPHYVDFQAELVWLRGMHRQTEKPPADGSDGEGRTQP